MISAAHYTAARSGAAVFTRTGRGLVRLTGADRLSYLQGLLTNDVAALAPGSGCYAALLTPQGRMISDMHVLETGEAVWLAVPADLAARVATHLSDFVFAEDVAVADVSDGFAQIAVLGPGAAAALGIDRLEPFASRRLTLAGADALAAGSDEFGVPAVDLFVSGDNAPAVLASLAAGGVATVDEAVGEVLRVEAGTPRFGVDMDHDTIPLEAGIEDRAISLTKGCYVGQEVIIRVLHRGHGRVARRLVGLQWPPGSAVPGRGDALRSGDREVGKVTSGTWSPALERPIALAYVHRDFTAPGTALAAGELRQPATVAALPFTATAAR